MMFTCDIRAYDTQLATQGYVHIRNAISAEFQKYLQQYYEQSLKTGHNEKNDGYIEGKKRQFDFKFPNDEVALEFRDEIAGLTGLRKNEFTLSERHIKAYDKCASEYPAPHKDRNASTYSIGIPIDLAPETSVCLFPSLDRSVNEDDSAIFMTDPSNQGFEYLYKAADTIVLHETLGDLVVFEGSAMFHERMKPSGTAILYLKINDLGLDPLRENLSVYITDTSQSARRESLDHARDQTL